MKQFMLKMMKLRIMMINHNKKNLMKKKIMMTKMKKKLIQNRM